MNNLESNKLTPKEQAKKSGESFKKAGKSVLQTTKGVAKKVGKTAEGLYHLIDKGYLAIHKKLGKSSNKVVDFTTKNIIKIFLAASILTYPGVKACQSIKDKKIDGIENNDNRYLSMDYLNFGSEEQNKFRNDSIFFDKEVAESIKNKKNIEILGEKVIILHDAGCAFYLVIPEDAKDSRDETINHIRKKLGNYPQFSYLNEDEYKPINDQKSGLILTKTFNIRSDYKDLAQNSSINKTPYWVPIPIKKEIREIKDEIFVESATMAINSILKSEYGNIWEIVMKEYTEKEIANLLTALAKIETGKTTSTIGTDVLHRREAGNHKCFSFGYQHVLMTGPGLKARKKLGLSEGQACHPINSNMLVMGFIAEKIKETLGTNPSDEKIAKAIINRLKFLKNKSLNTEDGDFQKFCEFYNGGNYKKNNYDKNFINAINQLNLLDDFKEYQVNKGNFFYENMDNKGENLVYSYIIPENEKGFIKNNLLKNIVNAKILRKRFKAEYGIESDNVQVCRRNGNIYEDNELFEAGQKVYIKFDINIVK